MQKMHQLSGRIRARVLIGQFVLSDTNGSCEAIFGLLHLPLLPADPRRFVQSPDVRKLVHRKRWPLLRDVRQMRQRFVEQLRSSIAITELLERPTESTQRVCQERFILGHFRKLIVKSFCEVN